MDENIKDQSRRLKDFKAGVSNANAKENKVNQLETQQKKKEQELNKIFKANSKLYKVNESEVRQDQAQKFAEFGKYAERESIGKVDPYDNTPSSQKKRGVSALSYATAAHTNNLLEKLLKVQDNSAFNQSLLNLQQQQVSLLGVISENIKTMRGVMEPTVDKATTTTQNDYQEGVSDLAKELATGQFDKALGTYTKSLLDKFDTDGTFGMIASSASMVKDMLSNGGLYQMINQSIRSTVKETLLGKELTDKLNAFVEDGPKFIQSELNKLATSNDKTIRELAAPAFKVNKVDLERKENKKDWAGSAKFDNKFYFTVTDIIPKALREIVGAVKNEEARQYNFDADGYLTESENILMEAQANRDKLGMLLTKSENSIGKLFEYMAKLSPDMAKYSSGVVDIENGRAKRDVNNNVIFKNKDIVDIIQKMLASGISVDQLGDNNDIFIKHMGLDINKPEQQEMVQSVRTVMEMLREANSRGGSDVKDLLTDMSTMFKDMHGKNTYTKYDGRLGYDVYEMARVLIENQVNDPIFIKRYKNFVDKPPKGPGGGFGGGTATKIKPADGIKPDPTLQAMRGYVDFDEATPESIQAYIDIQNAQKTKDGKSYKYSQEADDLLKGKSEYKSSGKSIKDLKSVSDATRAEEVWRLQERNNIYPDEAIISKDEYDIITNRKKSTTEEKLAATEKFNTKNAKLKKAMEIFSIISNAGHTAEAMAAIYNKPKSFFIKEGYISSPFDIMRMMDDNGNIIEAQAKNLGWSFVSDNYIKAEKAKQEQIAREQSLEGGNAFQSINKLVASAWNNPVLQKKLQIGSGSAAGLAIGAMLKNKGIIKSNLGIYAMGAVGAAVMQSERAKHMMDLLYGPDSGKVGANGFSNRDIMMAKMANKLLPAAAAASSAGATFKFSQKVFNSMGPMAGLIGLVPSTMAALAVGGITYKLLPKLKEKVQNAKDGKGMFGKFKEFAKGNKFLSMLFGLTGQRSNALIYAESLDPVIKELEIKATKLKEAGSLSEAEMMERQIEGLKSIQSELKSIDKDKNLPEEEKNSRASVLYGRMTNLITDANMKSNFEYKLKAAITERDKAKAGEDASTMQYTDHAKERAQDNINQYNNATTIDRSNIDQLVKSSINDKEHINASRVSKVKNLTGGAISDVNTLNHVTGALKQIKTGQPAERASGIAKLLDQNKIRDQIFNDSANILNYDNGLETFNQQYGTTFENKEDAEKYIKDNIDTLAESKTKETSEKMTDDELRDLLSNNFGAEMAQLLSDDSYLEKLSVEGNKLSDEYLDSEAGKDLKNQLHQESIEREKQELYNEAIKLGKSGNEIEAYVLGQLLKRNLERGNIKLDPERLRNMLSNSDKKGTDKFKVFEFMDMKSDRTGIDELDQFINAGNFITSDKSSKSSWETRQLIGNWLLKQIYMAKLGDNPTPEEYNKGFDKILKDYVTTTQNIKAKNNELVLKRLTDGQNSLTDLYGMNSTVNKIKNIMSDSSIDDNKKTDIISSLLMQDIQSGRISVDDIYNIIGSQYYLENEFDRLAKLRSAIVKNSNGENIPMNEHRDYIKYQLEKFSPKSAIKSAVTGVASRVMGIFNRTSQDEKLEAKADDEFLVKALTNLYGKPFLSNVPIYSNEEVAKGADGVSQYGYVTKGATWGENAPVFMNPDKLYDHVAEKYGEAGVHTNFMRYAGMGTGEDTINANAHTADNTTLKMNDLSGYKFINGMNLDSVGCSIAALNNALVKLGIPTLSKETMIDIANKHIDRYGIHINFFIDVCNRLGIGSAIYKGDTTRFDRDFFQRLQFNGSTYIALLDNLGSLTGAHYVNILDVKGNNVTINDPNQSGLTDLSASEFTARCSVIIRIDKAEASSPAKAIDTTLDKRDIVFSGSGIMNPFVSMGLPSMKFNGPSIMGKIKDKFFGDKSREEGSTEKVKNDTEIEGMFDPNVAQIATQISDEKQARVILSFMASSKNKAFAAAASRFRSLLTKPDVRAELKEKQEVADSEEQQGKDLSEINEKIGKGGLGGGVSQELLTQLVGALGGTAGSSLLSMGFSLYRLGKRFKKWWKKKNKNVKKTSKEIAEEGIENTGKEVGEETAENAVKTTSKEIGEEGAELAIKEGSETAVEKTIKETVESNVSGVAKNVSKETGEELAESVAKNVSKETAESVAANTTKKVAQESLEAGAAKFGGKAIVGAATKGGTNAGKTLVSKWNSAAKSADDLLLGILKKVFIDLPKFIVTKLIGNKWVGKICKFLGKNPDDIAKSLSGFFAKMMTKFKNFVSNSAIGKALSKAKNKMGAKSIGGIVSAVIEIGMFLYQLYKGIKDPAGKLNIPGVTNDHISKADATWTVARSYSWFEGGGGLITGLVSTFLSLPIFGGIQVPIYIQIAVTILLTNWIQGENKGNFSEHFKKHHPLEYNAIMAVAKGEDAASAKAEQEAEKLDREADKMDEEEKKALEDKSPDSFQQTDEQKANNATKLGNSASIAELNDKGGASLDNGSKSHQNTFESDEVKDIAKYKSLTERTSKFFSKWFKKNKDDQKMPTGHYGSDSGMEGGPGPTTGVITKFDFDNIPTPEALKDAKFTSNKAANERAKKFMALVLPIAKEMQAKGYFVDPYMMMTQWALESGWGASSSGDFNFYGIKKSVNKENYGPFWDGDFKTVDTTEVINGVRKHLKGDFRSYKTIEDGIRDYFWFLQNNFPDIKTKGTAGLAKGKYGVYATGGGYVNLVNDIYKQFANGMSNIGYSANTVMQDFVSDPDYKSTVNETIAEKDSNTGSSYVAKDSSTYGMRVLTEDYAYPLSSKRVITSVYGDRSDVAAANGGGMSSFHEGVDFRGEIGDPIFALADGKVIQDGKGTKMNTLRIKHKDGSVSVYMHNSKVVAKTGDTVKKGQKVAELGDRGTKHKHLHLGLIKPDGKTTDPFFELGLDPASIKQDSRSPENKRYVAKLNEMKNRRDREAKVNLANKTLEEHGKGGTYKDNPGGVRAATVKQDYQNKKVENPNKDMIGLLVDIRTLMSNMVQLLGIEAGVSQNQLSVLSNMAQSINDKSKLNFNNAAKTAMFIN